MAKVAKKSASSAKKSGAIKKVVAKKAEKQKKTTVKVTSSTSKKKIETKKVVPAKKTVAKKPISKSKVEPKKAISKPTVAKKSVAKAVAKPSKSISKAVTKAVAKKPVVITKEKAVAKATKPAKELDSKKKVTVAEAKITTPTVSAIQAAKVAGKPRRAKKKKDDDDDDEEVVVFRKPVKVAKASSKKSSSKYVSEELTLEGPAPTRIGPIVMTLDEKLKLKKALLHKCIDIQKNNVGLAKKAMEDALSSANEEKVTEELSDSFRESMHATRDMYARQAQEGVNNLGLLNRIMVQEHDKVKFGSVVFTNFQNYFISTSLGELKIEDKSFQTVSNTGR